MGYINAYTSHFRAVRDWAARNNAAANLDVCTFRMEVKCRGRYYDFHPQFVGTTAGRIVNTQAITGDTAGFIGWLPYRPLAYELSSDKLLFKDAAAAAGLKTPARWTLGDGQPAPDHDFILKRSCGSFGYEIVGPFKAGTVPSAHRQQGDTGRGVLFAEQYIPGSALKVWCWGQRPFFAHLRAPVALHGNGQSSVGDLIQARLAQAGLDLSNYQEAESVKEFLAYQGFTFDDVLEEGQSCLLDFRYGRDHTRRSSLVSDNELPGVPEATRHNIDRAAAAMAHILRGMLPAPVLYAIDAVVDGHGEVWWLELNSNPVLPPEGYEVMFSDLFAA